MQRLSRVAAFKTLARDIKGNQEFKTWLQSTGAEMDVPVVWDEDKPLSKSIFHVVNCTTGNFSGIQYSLFTLFPMIAPK